MNKFIRAELNNFSPYSSARKESRLGGISLHANESPWDVGFANAFSQLNRYPDQQPRDLLEKLAEFYQIRVDQLAVTRGSDEAIDLLIRLCCTPGKDKIITCSPTFGMYEVSAKLQGIQVIDVPLIADDFTPDFGRIKSAVDDSTSIIFLCSPNNPTGNQFNEYDLLALCEAVKDKCLLVIDEAYIEYANQGSLAKYINEHENLVILRTLSKAFGLAALRIGCLLSNACLVEWIKTILPPYPLPTPSVEIALARFDLDDVLTKVSVIKDERRRMLGELSVLPIVKKVWPSQANFLLLVFSKDIEKRLSDAGFVLRDMTNKMNIQHAYRLSIGKPEENTKLLNLLKEVSYAAD